MLAWQAARHLAILADEQRLSIVATLAQAGSRGLDIEQLADRLVCDSSDLRPALEKLCAGEFVAMPASNGRYSVNADLVESLTAFLSRRLQPNREASERVVALAGRKPKASRRGVVPVEIPRAEAPRPAPRRLSERLEKMSEVPAEAPRPAMPPALLQSAFRREQASSQPTALERKLLANRSIALLGLSEPLIDREAVDLIRDRAAMLAGRRPESDHEPFFVTERVAAPLRSGTSGLLVDVPKSPSGATLMFEQTSASPYALQRPVVVVRLPELVPVAAPSEPPPHRNGIPRKLSDALAGSERPH